ncbi:TlpA disulfide reductase family protein [Olsenella sp. HMSC062G07]|uniref:TlpA family protein disulfide reductase n=1 Tax=Olsenella sp. HMSC062G07 TaxID=1739330 RepID=UPI0008A183D1|nr:TlpA disulfide reductase family protein [Olsenella sp. HMSC062G07]OFK22818.1 redoxin [Olsenella sp. HMSC062G07]
MSVTKLPKIAKIAAALMMSALVLCLAACSTPGGDKEKPAPDDAGIEALIAEQPKNAEEATDLYNRLMQKENDILSSDKSLWEKVFAGANKDSSMIGDGSNYGDFLLATVEGAKDTFSADEFNVLKTGAEKIKKIEDKLAALKKEFPDCASTPGAGESVDAASAGMTGDAGKSTKFPSFKGKDLDGNDVSSDELFSKSKVTVMNFWFTSCKPCVEELGELEALNKKLAEKGGQVVGVNSFTLDGNQGEISDAKDVLSKKGVTYKNVWFNTDGDAGKLVSGLFSFPTTYVIDSNGNVVGDPIVGAITSAAQREALDRLIDQAIANSAK